MIEDSLAFAEDKRNYIDINPYPFKLHSDPTKTILCEYQATVIYGDTDSIYTMFDTSMLIEKEDKIAYSMEIGRIVSKRITVFLRKKNTYKNEKDKWTELGTHIKNNIIYY